MPAAPQDQVHAIGLEHQDNSGYPQSVLLVCRRVPTPAGDRPDSTTLWRLPPN